MLDLKDIFRITIKGEENTAPVKAVLCDVIDTLVDFTGTKYPDVEDFYLWLRETQERHGAQPYLCTTAPEWAKDLMEKGACHPAIRNMPLHTYDILYPRLAEQNIPFAAVNDQPLLPLAAGAVGVIDPHAQDAREFLRRKSYLMMDRVPV